MQLNDFFQYSELLAYLKVPGGDPISLTGHIHLCGRSNGDPERHFDGSVAHLSLFDTTLSGQEIFTMYEEFLVAAEGIQIVHPVRRTVTGEQCLFPGIHQ